MIVHLIDGTYELFRHFYGLRRFNKGEDPPFGAVVGVLHTVLQMLETGRDAHRRRDRSRHRVVPQRSLARLQDRRRHRARAVGAVPSARRSARRDGRRRRGRWSSSKPTTRSPPPRTSRARTRRVEKVCIWTPDKDLAQCVRGDRVVQVDRKRQQDPQRRGACARSSASTPALIPDYLALVGDAADGYPGIPGIGAVTAARLLNRHGPHRGFSARRARRAARARAAVQEARDAATPMRRCSATSTSCAGAGSHRFAAWTERMAPRACWSGRKVEEALA